MSTPYRNIRRAFSAYYTMVPAAESALKAARNIKINQKLWQKGLIEIAAQNRRLAKYPTRTRAAVSFMEWIVGGPHQYNANLTDQEKLTQLNARLDQLPPAPAGPHFFNSFLGYAPARQFRIVCDAWERCRELLAAGTQFANNPGIPLARATIERWFGTTDRNKERLRLNMAAMQARVNAGHTNLMWRSSGMTTQRYREYDDTAPTFGLIQCSNDSIAMGNRLGDRIHILPAFFDGSTDLPGIHQRERGGAFTFGGVLVHELSHNSLGTYDVMVPFLRRTDEASSAAEHGSQDIRPQGQINWDEYRDTYNDDIFVNYNQRSNSECYGVARCELLSMISPADAIINADSYRLFCEDAHVKMT